MAICALGLETKILAGGSSAEGIEDKGTVDTGWIGVKSNSSFYKKVFLDDFDE